MLQDMAVHHPNTRILNTQSPSERWDGDCAWSQGTLNCFGSIYSVMNTMGVIGQSLWIIGSHVLGRSFLPTPTSRVTIVHYSGSQQQTYSP